MDRKIKAKWMKALRSGEYEQGRGRLRSKDRSYCCLGVLCDVIDPTIWQGGELSYPSDEMMRKAELERVHCLELAEMNDNERLTFKEIAKYIEVAL